MQLPRLTQPVAGSELDEESAAALNVVARRSLNILCITMLVLGVADILVFVSTDLKMLLEFVAQAESAPAGEEGVPDLATAQAAALRGWGRLVGQGAALTALAVFLFLSRKRKRTAAETMNVATLLIMLVGALLLASRLVLQKAIPNAAAWGIVDLFVLHLVTCFIMPWKPREAALPFVPLLLAWAAAFLVPTAAAMDILDRVVGVIVSPLILIPGSVVASWRVRRRDETAERRELQDRVQLFGGELSRARIVHDAMFPRPFTGHVAFEYEYQPIQEIGGDYVHTYVCPESGKVTLTLLDVAGHGLAAALTVNRLFGELERILAENAAAEPPEVMRLLNRYINLTMARHSLYATGTCMMLNPSSGELTWVNAGHPPCLVRHASGEVSDLPTTTVLLGALESDEFEPGLMTMSLNPGDAVIAYTDGAFEARDADGHRFGLDRIRATAGFDPPPRSWPKFIAGAVAQHHAGHAEDDVLIAAMTLRSMRVSDDEDGIRGSLATAGAD
jgi:serine phosphatase RsbU (regulator of sigma subunit)